MNFTKLFFTRNWTNPKDFPTVETDEATVRSDMQCLFDEIKDYINSHLLGEVSAGIADAEGKAGKPPYIGDNGHWFQYDTEAKEYVDTGIAATGPSGSGTGDMLASVYDPQGKREDIYDYVEHAAGATKMDKDNPSGTGSMSMNRRSGTTVGGYSTVFGRYCAAIGTHSTAIGSSTTAKGLHSFSAGFQTVASGQDSFVAGRTNIEDTEDKYVLIIGNGKAEDDGTGVFRDVPSNAMTLDWEGNLEVKGTIKSAGGADEQIIEVYPIKASTEDDNSPHVWPAIADDDYDTPAYFEIPLKHPVDPWDYDELNITVELYGALLIGGSSATDRIGRLQLTNSETGKRWTAYDIESTSNPTTKQHLTFPTYQKRTYKLLPRDGKTRIGYHRFDNGKFWTSSTNEEQRIDYQLNSSLTDADVVRGKPWDKIRMSKSATNKDAEFMGLIVTIKGVKY